MVWCEVPYNTGTPNTPSTPSNPSLTSLNQSELLVIAQQRLNTGMVPLKLCTYRYGHIHSVGGGYIQSVGGGYIHSVLTGMDTIRLVVALSIQLAAGISIRLAVGIYIRLVTKLVCSLGIVQCFKHNDPTMAGTLGPDHFSRHSILTITIGRESGAG